MSNFVIVGGDTDGLAFKKPNQKPFTPEERAEILKSLNEEMDELIKWEDDGVFKRQIIIKTKNYILQDEKNKVTIKGSALKATNKEPALKEFIDSIVGLLLKDRKDQILFLYMQYAKEIKDVKDISRWCVKKTVTKSVLNGTRTNETRVLEALNQDEITEGDKVYLFFEEKKKLTLRENFKGVYERDLLLAKLYNTLKVFKTIIDIEMFPNFKLRKNKGLLDGI